VQDVRDRLEDQAYETEFTSEMKAELDRRIAEMDRNPGASASWEYVKAPVLGRLRK
jgi:putative addiction module component (TIGR02574 family)